jgi:NAD-dependent deacetylase
MNVESSAGRASLTHTPLDGWTNIVVLTGAGISAESGIRTFRGADGLWEGHSLEEVATPYGWAGDPAKVWRFYQQRRAQLAQIEPNNAHISLARLEAAMPNGNFTLITQNVDNLHGRAGSNNLIHMHGELRLLRCEVCGEVGERMEPEHLEENSFVGCDNCQNDMLRPHIVWFHEMPFELERIDKVVNSADIFLVVGTSGQVYPAAGLLEIARSAGAYCIGVNLEVPSNVDLFHEFHQGAAGELLPQLIDEWSKKISIID